eukprot:6200269-Pleurochrysis_carterae.AAC.1
MVEDYVPPSEDSLTNVFASLEIPSVMGVVPIPARVCSTVLLLHTLESRSQENQRPDEVSRACASAQIVVHPGVPDQRIRCGRCAGGE